MKGERIILLAGGNHPSTLELLCTAINMLGKEVGKIICTSSLYKTAAWGPIPQPDFINIAIVLKSNFPAQLLLKKILSIEAKLGRKRTIKYGPRTIDFDVLFYGNQIINSKTLTVPHPEITNRRFVLMPCCELIPNFVHPKLKMPLYQLLLICPDELEVSLW